MVFVRLILLILRTIEPHAKEKEMFRFINFKNRITKQGKHKLQVYCVKKYPFFDIIYFQRDDGLVYNYYKIKRR